MQVRRRFVNIQNNSINNGLNIFSKVRKIDGFSKLPKECVNKSNSGGCVSILIFLIISGLIISEISRYFHPSINFEYSVDHFPSGLLPINIDMTVAMKCSDISLDFPDSSINMPTYSARIKRINTLFELSHIQSGRFKILQSMLSGIREAYHSIYELFWLSESAYHKLFDDRHKEIFENEVVEEEANSCRFIGTFHVKKTKGSMHVISGIPLDLSDGMHMHISSFVVSHKLNYSHRIHHLSFGQKLKTHISPLDAEEAITPSYYTMYQYFFQIVPTTFHSGSTIIETFQYAVTEQARVVNHTTGSHGLPGIFMHYEMSPIRVDIFETHVSFSTLLLRLAALSGGVLATMNFICQLITHLLPTCLRVYGLRHRQKLRTGTDSLEPLIPEPDT